MTFAPAALALALFRTTETVTFLRRLMTVDAVTSGAMGVMLVAGAGLIAPITGLPPALLRASGFILIPFALIVGWVAAKAPAHRGAVLTIAVVNAAWVLASLGLLVSGRVSPTLLGMAFVGAQALFVAVLAELQVIGARRLAR